LQPFFNNPLVVVLRNSLIVHKAPSNLTYSWNWGSYAGLILVIQIISGLLLAMHYIPDINIAFSSVEHIMRDVNEGWMLRYIHANGASMFFIIVYLHIFRGLYMNSFTFPRQIVWILGVFIFLLMIIIAFMGYVLPWGQMSFWGATVITNLMSAIPFIGNDIVIWLWGGYSIDNATLNRFFVLHFFLPFVLAVLVVLHILFLHKVGSNNPLGIFVSSDFISFSPYYIIKDAYGFLLFICFFSFFVFFYPDYLGHYDNYIEANPLVTPSHIVPEWYLLPFYAILRSIPNKLLGVIALILAILILIILPFNFTDDIRNTRQCILSKTSLYLFVGNVVFLGWLGAQPAIYPYNILGAISSIFYFSWLIIPSIYYHKIIKNLINFTKSFNRKGQDHENHF